MKRALLIAVAMTLTVAVSAWGATVVKRIPTKKQTVVRHVHDHLEINTITIDHPVYASHIRCTPRQLRNGRSKTWTCSFHYQGARLSDSAPLACRVRYRVGLEQQVVNGHGMERAWNDHKLGSKVCRRM